MAILTFDTGVKSYDVNGTPDVFSINPTDAAFVERVFRAFEDLDKRQTQKEATISKTGDKQDVIRLTHEYDAEMRTLIDELLGQGVSAKVFGQLNVYAMAGGLPVWANFLLALLDECDTAFAREQKATNPKLKQYLAKYQKK